MQATICGVKIRGVCATVPARICYFDDELKEFPFPKKSSRRLGKVMGFKEHRITDPQTTPCDLASYTMNYLFHKGYLEKEAVRALIVAAQTADHPIPGNSKVVHGQLGLPRDTFCTDIYENCIGFISGLYTACSMIAASDITEVVLVTTDAGACCANKLDRNTYPLCGDAAAVTVVRKTEDPNDAVSFVFQTDGSRREALMTPAGGRRMPYSEETAKVYQDEMGNYRCLNNLHMDGTAVFQFVMEEVPPLIEAVCRYTGIRKDDIHYHLTHQPNRFMLQKLADLMEVPREKLFNNIVENFGNSSSVTIPVNIAFNLGSVLLTQRPLVCYSAFGAGLSLAAAVCRLGHLDFCELIEHPGEGTIEYSA
jgi:3-oxoacyl-[acyl-carrier-protein] synthase-3